MTITAAVAPGPGSELERGAFIGRLTPPFARLYSSSTDVKRVLRDAGLERLSGWLKIDDEAMVVWFRVLAGTSENGHDFEAIIRVARREGPDDLGLRSALEENARTTQDQSAVTARVLTAPVLAPTEAEEPGVRLVDREELVGLLESEVTEVGRSRRARSLLLVGDGASASSASRARR